MPRTATATASKSTRVVGWQAARNLRAPGTALRDLAVTGPGSRPVRVQMHTSGTWKTVRTLRTTHDQGLNLQFLTGTPGKYRLVVAAWQEWTGKTTSALQILTRKAQVRNAIWLRRKAKKPRPSRPAPTPTPTPTPTPKPTGPVSHYGPSFNMDGLGNMQIGGTDSGAPNTSVSVRFRAERSGTITAFRAYWLGADYPGYGGGTGGTIRASIRTDNGGIPSSTVLASVDNVHPSTLFPVLKFSSPATVTAGQVYHLVFTNVDPSPVENFSSINFSWVSGSALVPRQPNISDDDYAAVRRFGNGAWFVDGQYTPIVDLSYGNGTHQGKGYMEVEYYTPAIISGKSNMVREQFTVSGGNRVVTGAAVRLGRTSGSGDLTVRLESAGGTVIDSFTVPASSVPRMGATDDPGGVWVTGKFSTPRTLSDGTKYHLRLSTDSSTSLWTRGIQQGDSYGFDAATYFDDGFLQVTTDGGSSWSTVSGLETSGDLQFYLN